jgi:hypothetical protein
MKKLLSLIVSAFIAIAGYSQTATNADGSLKLRGNVAIISTYHAFTFKNGVFEQQVNDEVATMQKSAINAMAMQAFGNSGFGIVNRDNEAYNNVMKQLEEQKLEDYIDGFSVKAKGEGADCLCLIDNTIYTENDFIQTIVSIRFINIENNMGYHYSFKSKPVNMADANEVQKESAKMADKTLQFLYKHILEVYPEQYGIAKADGKKLHLVAYQPNGRILLDDKWYAFKLTQDPLTIGNQTISVPVLQKIGEAKFEGADGGYAVVKADKAIQPSQDIILFRNQDEPNIPAGKTPMTFFALNYNPKTHDGFIKNRVNNAVYDAITRHPGMVLIEQEHLPDLKKERELQKTEDFIDGHVVEQMKAIGAQFMLHLDNFVMEGSKVSFQLNLVSVAENRIVRNIDVSTSVDNIENEMYKQICERLTYPCNVKQTSKKELSILSGWALGIGEKISVIANKKIENPITKDVSYSKIPLCNCTVTEYMCNKFVVEVDDVINEEDFKLIEKYSNESALSIKMDGSDIESDDSNMSDVEKAVKKQEGAKKRKSFLKGLGDALKNNSSVGVETR